VIEVGRGSLAICAVALVVVTTTSCPSARTARPTARGEAAEGTREDPSARARQEWQQLRDPATGVIPRDIGTRENAFAGRLAALRPEGHVPIVGSWKSRGPANVGGRTKALAIDVLDEDVILAGGVSSGMWRSSDGGATWRMTTRPDQLHSVSCIAQNTAAGRENVWYYGTGEWGGYGSGGSAAGPISTNAFYRGDGVFKSTDGGRSWSQLPSTAYGDPTSTGPFDFVWGLATFGVDGVFAATSTGLWKSTDGGASWDHVLSFGDSYPSTEVAIGPNGTVWATIGGDGTDAGIYRSPDGAHWDKLQPPGWPAKTRRTVIGVVPTNPSKAFFWTAEDEPQQLRTHLYRYVEGAGWTDLRPNLPWGGDMVTYGASMLVIKVKPDDENTLFLGAMNVHRSVNGGQSWLLVDDLENAGRFHVDQHSFAFYPSNPRRMIVGNDGGVFRTEDNLTSLGQYQQIAWQPLNNGYLTTQFYSVAVDHATPGSAVVSGGMQDNGCQFTSSTDPSVPWETLWWGDGGSSAIADGGQYHYVSAAATLQVMKVARVHGQLQYTEVTPTGALMGLWLAPMLLDPHDTRIMYLPARHDLWRNSDLTQIPYAFPSAPTSLNWTRLTNVTLDNLAISAIAMSDAMPRRLYCGAFGRLFRLDNPDVGQPVPITLSQTGLPQFAYVGCLAVDPRDVDKVIVVFPNYGVVSIFASEDGGQHWTPEAGNLEEHPDGSGAGPSVRWVTTLYVGDQPVYFAGTSVGLFSTTALDGMNTVWVQEGAATIGNVVVDMIDVRQSDGYVAVGTHGNGIYTATVADTSAQVRRHLSHSR
jgi:hypothetical protein